MSESYEAMRSQSAGGVTPARRSKVIDELCEAFAQDRIELADLEKRLEEATRARWDSELVALVASLPAREGLLDAPDGSHSPSSPDILSSAPPGSPGLRTIDPGRVPDRQLTVAFLGGRARKGSWIPARRMTAIALQGGIVLDFREALFGVAVTELRAVAIMGGVDVVVPPGVHVETSGFAIMGGFDDDIEPMGPRSDQAPVLRITGFALMGGVSVRVLLPGETERQARQRKRESRRQTAADRLSAPGADGLPGPTRDG